MIINFSLGVFFVHCVVAPVKLQLPTLVMLMKFSLVSLSVSGRKVTAYLARYSSTFVLGCKFFVC